MTNQQSLVNINTNDLQKIKVAFRKIFNFIKLPSTDHWNLVRRYKLSIKVGWQCHRRCLMTSQRIYKKHISQRTMTMKLGQGIQVSIKVGYQWTLADIVIAGIWWRHRYVTALGKTIVHCSPRTSSNLTLFRPDETKQLNEIMKWCSDQFKVWQVDKGLYQDLNFMAQIWYCWRHNYDKVYF